MSKKPKKDRIAWECPHCGHRHLWKWDRGEAQCVAPITMYCDACAGTMKTWLLQIGAAVYAAVWKHA